MTSYRPQKVFLGVTFHAESDSEVKKYDSRRLGAKNWKKLSLKNLLENILVAFFYDVFITSL